MEQLAFRLPQRGGKRRGAGRKPRGERAGVSHKARPKFGKAAAVHVTLRVHVHVWNLRSRRCFRVIETCFGDALGRFGLRIVEFTVLGNHLHLIVEAEDRASLAKGMQGLAIRIAKTLNRLFARDGKVWADRYHSHVLRARREVANVLRYVLGNFARHARQWSEQRAEFADAFSSIRFLGLAPADAPVAAPRTWLLRIGWR